jgi:hypothetical protein
LAEQAGPIVFDWASSVTTARRILGSIVLIGAAVVLLEHDRFNLRAIMLYRLSQLQEL